jgi:hypothetical protein
LTADKEIILKHTKTKDFLQHIMIVNFIDAHHLQYENDVIKSGVNLQHKLICNENFVQSIKAIHTGLKEMHDLQNVTIMDFQLMQNYNGSMFVIDIPLSSSKEDPYFYESNMKLLQELKDGCEL